MKLLTLAAMAMLTTLAACTSASDGGNAPTVSAARQADEVLSTADLRTLIVGKSVSFSGGGTAIYAADGGYTYRGSHGTDRGRYLISGNQVCVDFTDGFRRCDRYVRSGSRYVLINASGNRFWATIR